MGLAGGEYGVILRRRRLVRMNVTGDVARRSRMIRLPRMSGALRRRRVRFDRTVFFLSDEGFKALDDGRRALRHIGSERVDRTFRALVPRADYERIFSAVDQSLKLVWMVPGAPAYVPIYNYALDKRSEADLPLTGCFRFTTRPGWKRWRRPYPRSATTISLDDPVGGQIRR